MTRIGRMLVILNAVKNLGRNYTEHSLTKILHCVQNDKLHLQASLGMTKRKKDYLCPIKKPASMKIKLFTIPNMITLLNLLAGCIAVFYAFRGDLQVAFYLICLAAVFDFLDGFAARALKAYSAVGKELDSLADMISFGFAPAAILLEMFQMSGGTGFWGWSMFLLAAFSALRLAKFNIDESQTDEFRGLPTPACTLLVASLGFLYAGDGMYASLGIWPLAGLLALLCFLLVCNIRMFSLKFHSWGLRENMLRYIFLAVSVALLALLQVAAVPVIILGYILVSTVRHFVIRAK